MRKLWLLPGKYDFTHQWFANRNLADFRTHVLSEWGDKPIRYLELGVFEGMSMLWMMQRVLTHPDSRAVGIDPWLITRKISAEGMDEVRKRAEYNLFPYRDRCTLIRGNSVEVLRRMRRRRGFAGISTGNLDLCMIDGDHNSLGVLSDARNCFHLLRPGGQVIFDDVDNDKLKKDHVKEGLGQFLEECSDRLELVWEGRYAVCYRKKETL